MRGLQADRLATYVDSKLWPEVDHAISAANRMGGPQRPYVRQLLTPALRMMEVLLDRCARMRMVCKGASSDRWGCKIVFYYYIYRQPY